MIIFGKITGVEPGLTETKFLLNAKTEDYVAVNYVSFLNEDVGDDMVIGAIVCIIVAEDMRILVYGENSDNG